jgi:RHS repeat-associated protein
LQRVIQRDFDATAGARPEAVRLGIDNNASSVSLETVEHNVGYHYDDAGRLDGIDATGLPAAPGSSSGHAFHYQYAAGGTSGLSPHLITAVHGPAHRVFHGWDSTRDVLAYKENRNTLGTATFAKYDYSVNSIGQRIGVVESGQNLVGPGARDWSYNSSGELIGEDASGSIHDRGYRYDDLGNRLSSARGTTDPALATAGNLGVYKATVGGAAGANSLNQYGEVTLPGVATVPVVHDLDGNMTSGPLPATPGQASSLAWDAENRLVEVGVGTAATQVQFRYDPIGRRIAKITPAKTELYVYDGWNLVGTYTADLTADSATMATAYTWGLDLSGNLQGAGGVGGLLAIHEQAGNGSAKAGQVIYPLYDGNGNIVRLLNSGGGVVASYAYDGFGNRLNAAASDIDGSGYAEEQEFGFSTKFRDVETGLIYYGYRYYDPVTGRWPSRDPIEERGGANLYGFVFNSPVSIFDILGREPATPKEFNEAMAAVNGDGSKVWDEIRRRRRLKDDPCESCEICESGTWEGKGTVSRFQFAFGWVSASGEYTCTSNPITAKVSGSGDGPAGMGAFGLAADLTFQETSFVTITGAKSKCQLKGKLMIDQISSRIGGQVGITNIGASVTSNNDGTFDISGSVSIGVPKTPMSGGGSASINNEGERGNSKDVGVGVNMPFEVFNVTSILVDVVH